MPYADLTKEELMELKKSLKAEYKAMQAKDLKLDMSRGKPSQEQLDISMGLMDVLSSDADLMSENGSDCRNYGVLDGIPEAKELMGDMMEVPADNLIIYGNSSLNVMYDCISRSYTHGVMGSTPWCKLDKVKFLCIVPGYDRHFAITEYFGFENVCIPMLESGPDMDMIEELVQNDDSIKGIWCVPKYSNPTGNSYSDEVVRRFARLKPAAKDFRIYWDNAYTIHHLYDLDQDHLIEILAECKRAGNPDLVYKFASTSKVTFPGAGISVMASSEANIKYLTKSFGVQVISFDKLNQIRHVKFLKDKANTLALMREHAKIMKPKFDTVIKYLDREIAPLGIGSWVVPKGGYFVSYEAMEHTAKRVLELAKEAGVEMTPAGATFPCRKDPQDSNIRIAPSLPPVEELEDAMDVFCICAKLAALEKLV